jgi:cytochrome c biogenesis protein CcmG/thiol:disulfide interchange protein DsbE
MRYKPLLPLAIFLLIALLLASGLLAPKSMPPSPLMGRALPGFSLPNIEKDKAPLTPMDWSGQPAIVNVFASWCEPCKAEQPLLLALAKQGVRVYGIAWRDTPDKTVAYLQQYGNPYQKIGMDTFARVTIELGISGVPETFVVDGKGIVRWKIAGPLTEDMIATNIQPLLKK